MKFCDECGSYMRKTKVGFVCRKCGNVVHVGAGMKTEHVKKTERSSSICVVERAEDEYLKVYQPCPKCGNTEAFRWASGVSGEHAGIRRERAIVHFKCTKCFHLWTKKS